MSSAAYYSSQQQQQRKRRGGVPGIDAFTVLMLHCDGFDGSTIFTDSSAAAHAMTAVGNAQISAAQSVFGARSALFDGNDYLTTPDSTDWSLGSGAFTLEAWIRYTDTSSNYPFILSQWVGGTAWEFSLAAGTNLRFQYSTTGVDVFSLDQGWTPALNTWYHVAVVRSGNVLKHFVNGTQLGTDLALTATIFNASSVLAVGARGDGTFGTVGWLDEVRVSKGIARWTANFTPPTAAYR